MYPPNHVAVAYLAGRIILHRVPAEAQVWMLAFFALLPDLLDKGLHYGLGLFSSGRNILHSLCSFALLLVAAGIVRIPWLRRGMLLALVGIGTHLFVDTGQALVQSMYSDFSAIPDWYLYLLFPFRDPQLLAWAVDPVMAVFEAAFFLAVLWLWMKDGAPGFPRPSRPPPGNEDDVQE